MTILIVKIVLAVLFGMAGLMKATRSMDQLAGAGMTWVNEYPESSVRLVGILELLGAMGVILPALFIEFPPVVTLISSTSLGVVMILAALHHYKHKEFKNIIINVVLWALCAMVTYNSL